MTMAWMRARLTARTLSWRASPASRQEWLWVSKSFFFMVVVGEVVMNAYVHRTTPPCPVGIATRL